MAKGDKDKKTAAPVTTVTIKDLEKAYNQDARKIRAVIRSLGMKAPAVETEGFGPKAKYEWPSDSADLAKIREALTTAKSKSDAAKPGDEDDD